MTQKNKQKFKTRIDEHKTLPKIKDNKSLYEKYLNDLNHPNKNLANKNQNKRGKLEEKKKNLKYVNERSTIQK